MYALIINIEVLPSQKGQDKNDNKRNVEAGNSKKKNV